MKSILKTWRAFFVLLVCLLALPSVESAHAQDLLVGISGGGIAKFSSTNGILSTNQTTFAGRSSILDSPYGLTFDSSGNLYVADLTSHTIVKFASTNGILATNGTLLDAHGSSPTSPFAPASLVFDRDANLYVANFGDNTIVKYAYSNGILDTNGTFFANSNTVVSAPAALAFDGGGNLFVANSDVSTIVEFTCSNGILSTNGTIFAGSSTNVSGPLGMAFDRNGNLYVANYGNNTIVKFARDNGMLSPNATTFVDASSGGPLNPYRLAFDSNDNLFAIDFANDRILKFASVNGTLTTNASSFSVSGSPVALAFQPPPSLPRLSIASTGNQVIVFYPLGGASPTLQISTNLSSTNWVTATNGTPVTAYVFTNVPSGAFFRLH